MEHLGQKFSGMFTCTTQEFLEVFGKFDKDGNGYIEEAELDGLVKDLLALDDKVKEAKQMILEIADANYDGKIDMSEMAALLLPKERFLAQFQFKNPMAPEEFMKIWRNYDSDWNGYIDGGEIRAFVCDILSVNGSEVSPQRIDDYAKEMLELFDKDKDGRFSFYELSRVVKEVDCILKTVTMHKVSDEKFNSLFNHYDRDDNGYIEGDELKNLVKTIIYMNKGRPAESGEVDTLIKTMLPIFDLNKDGKFDKGELRMVYGGKE